MQVVSLETSGRRNDAYSEVVDQKVTPRGGLRPHTKVQEKKNTWEVPLDFMTSRIPVNCENAVLMKKCWKLRRE